MVLKAKLDHKIGKETVTRFVKLLEEEIERETKAINNINNDIKAREGDIEMRKEYIRRREIGLKYLKEKCDI